MKKGHGHRIPCRRWRAGLRPRSTGEMHQRLSHPPKQQPHSHAGREEHSKPGRIGELRLILGAA